MDRTLIPEPAPARTGSTRIDSRAGAVASAVLSALASATLWVGCATATLPESQRALASTPRLSAAQFRAEKLAQAGLSPRFIHVLNSTYARATDEEEAAKVVELNVLGFLGKADYSGHYSPRAIRQCKKFMRAHRTMLARAEKKYGVQKEVIAALLWVETKHGKVMGTFNVASVYLSLLEADRPDRIQMAFEAALGREPAGTGPAPTPTALKDKVVERARAKSTWAASQLKALEQMHLQGYRDARTLKGSYAGAFGIPQFVPSSYIEWARPARAGRKANLFRVPDAITSVASYLSAQGWKKSDDSTHRSALHHYNRSDGYVDVILRIAAELAPKKSRANPVSTVISKKS